MAELYDQVAPCYPEELVGDIVALSGIPAGGRILEIGCGPGNATLLFASRGYSITAIELGEKLATLAAKNCRAYPGVEVQNVAFEDWPLEENAFHLAIAADAFHWIPPEVGYPKLARALVDSGSAALFWNVPVDPDSGWSREIEAVFLERAPGVEYPDRLFAVEWLEGIIEENFYASGCFGPVAIKRYPGSEVCTAEAYIGRLRTYSGLRGLDEGARDELFAGIRDVIEGWGGRVEKPTLVALFQARVQGGWG